MISSDIANDLYDKFKHWYQFVWHDQAFVKYLVWPNIGNSLYDKTLPKVCLIWHDIANSLSDL